MNNKLQSDEPLQGAVILPVVHEDFLRCLQTVQSGLQALTESGRPDDETQILTSALIAIQAIRTRQPDSELSKYVGNLGTTITDMLEPLRDIAESAQRELAELEHGRTEVSNAPSTGPTDEEIENELIRRSEERTRIATIQEGLEDEREHLLNEIGVHNNLAKAGLVENPRSHGDKGKNLETRLEILKGKIQRIVDGLSRNDDFVQALVAYRDAAALIGRGIPSEMMGKRLVRNF